MVEDTEGTTFDVELEGKRIRDLDRGVLYYVVGEVSNGEDKYDLFYLTAMFDRLPQIYGAPNTE